MKLLTTFTTFLIAGLIQVSAHAANQLEIIANSSVTPMASTQMNYDQYANYNFGTVFAGTMNTAYFTVFNRSNTYMQFSHSTTWGMEFSDNHNCYGGLYPSQSCTYRVRYWPSFEGYHNGQSYIQFYDSRGYPSRLNIDLWGRAIRR